MALYINILTGLIVGTFSGLFGIGGGIILVPILLLAYGMEAKTAIGTSLIALLLPVGALGVYQFWKNGAVTESNFRIGLTIAIGIFFGAFFGSKLALYLPEKLLRYFFATVLFLVGIKIILK